MLQSNRNDALAGRIVLSSIVCYFGIIIEGFDNATGGHIGTKVAKSFGFSHAELGLSFSVNALGLLLGAIASGWLADRIGRKPVLIGCFVLFGSMSIATAFTTQTEWYFAARFFTGFGIGGSVPTLIAVSAELGPVSSRMSRVTILSSGLPLGGALCGALSYLLPSDYDWRLFFVIGGVAPLVLALLFAVVLPHDPPPARESRHSISSLFEGQRWIATLCMWVSFFLSMMTLGLMVNWLPSLIVGNGHSFQAGALATALFSLGGVFGGVLFGMAVRTVSRFQVFLCAYLALMASIAVVGIFAENVTLAIVGSASTGAFLIAATTLLYGLAPTVYPAGVRATGVGFAVAAGRSGSIAGPLMAGIVLQLGGTPSTVLFVTIPLMMIALVALVPVLRLTPVVSADPQ